MGKTGNCLKYLKRERIEKEGRGNKDLKKARQARSRGECLKKGVEPSFRLGIDQKLKNKNENLLVRKK